MLKITFKDVGQGDCIVVEWGTEGKRRIGVIDSKKVRGTNPVISHIRRSGYDQIEFIVLSHPHADHFSGLEEILLYCESQGVSISYFLHTCSQVPEFLASAVTFEPEKRDLDSLFKTVRRLKGSTIQKVTAVNDETRVFPLDPHHKMRFLSPSSDEFEKYTDSTYKDRDLSRKNNPAANWLSTITLIEGDGEYIVLTSDAERGALKRATYDYLEDDDRIFRLGQVPHHGSSGNHYNRFWRTRNLDDERYAAISVGLNSYGHPSVDVIEDLRELGYQVEKTSDQPKRKREKKIKSVHLDALSNKSPSPANSVDLEYHLSPPHDI